MMRSSRGKLVSHLQEHKIEQSSETKGMSLSQLGGFLSKLQEKMTRLVSIGEQSGGQLETFKGIIAQLSTTLDEMGIKDHFLSSHNVLQEQIREWVSVECARLFFQLQLDKSKKISILSDDGFLYVSPAESSAVGDSKKSIFEGQRAEALTLTQRITLNIRLRFVLKLAFTVRYPAEGEFYFVKEVDHNPLVLDKGVVTPFAGIIPSEFESRQDALTAHSKCQSDHAHLLSRHKLPTPFVQFCKFLEAEKIGAETLEIMEEAEEEADGYEAEDSEAEDSEAEETTPSLADKLRKSFNETFYVVEKEDKERSFIHYFLGLPKRKDHLTPGWSTFFLGWDILFYVAGMWLITPLKNIVKLGIEFLPKAAYQMFFSMANWMHKKSDLGFYICAGFGAVFGGVWLVGRALTSPFASLKAAFRACEALRVSSPALGWVATVLLMGISGAISLAGIATIAAVSSIFYPAIAGAVIGEGLAASAVPVPPMVAATVGVVVVGDQVMQSCEGCCTTRRLIGDLQLEPRPESPANQDLSDGEEHAHPEDTDDQHQTPEKEIHSGRRSPSFSG